MPRRVSVWPICFMLIAMMLVLFFALWLFALWACANWRSAVGDRLKDGFLPYMFFTLSMNPGDMLPVKFSRLKCPLFFVITTSSTIVLPRRLV